MSVEVRIAGVLLNGRVSIPDDTEGFVDAAQRGQVGTGGVIVEDPAGDLTITGWQTFTVDDLLATPTRLFTGFIRERSMGRGGKFRTGVGRVHNCTIVDLNSLLHTKLERFIDNDGKRPAETDVARLSWLLTARPLDSVIYDEGLVSSVGPVNLLAAEERDKFADDIINEFCDVAGKDYFVYRDAASGHPALFYDHDEATVWAAGISISNVIADKSATCFYPSLDGELTRTPEDRYTAVDYRWQGNPVFAESAATLASLGMSRESLFSTDRVGHLATAQSEAIRWLNQHAAEQDVIAVTLELPSASVNLAYAGQEIDVKFTHLPGYESFVTTRIRRRDARPLTRGKWSVRFELWVPPTPATDAAFVVPTTPPTPTDAQLALIPFSPPNVIAVQDFSDADRGTNTWVKHIVTSTGATSTALDPMPTTACFGFLGVKWNHVQAWSEEPNWLMFMVHTAPGGAEGARLTARVFGSTNGPGGVAHHWAVYHGSAVPGFADVSGVTKLASGVVTPETGGLGVVTSTTPYQDISVEIPVIAGKAIFGFGFDNQIQAQVYGDNNFSVTGAQPRETSFPTPSPTPPGDDALANDRLDMRRPDQPITTVDTSIFYYLTFYDAGLTTPLFGQPVVNELDYTGDGATSIFHTLYPYAAGSLQVMIDGIWVTANVTEVDSTNGTYSISPIPGIGDKVRSFYMGAGQ